MEKSIHLIPQFGRGGAEQIICTLISRIEGRGGFVGSSGGEGIRDLDKLGIPWTPIPLFPSNSRNALRSFIVLRRIARERGIGIIHSHHRFSSLIGRAVAAALKIPFVCTVHDLAEGHRLISRFALGDTVMVFSQAVATHVMEHLNVKREHIYRIPMGMVPIEMSAPEQILRTRRQMGCSQRTPVVGFIGRLEPEKGPDYFLRSAPQVLRQFPEARFWVIGDGAMRGELESLVRRLRISEFVTFLGWRADTALVTACIDLMVIPSLREGFGRAALESLILGKPVIATQVGGLPELVTHNENGLLIPPGRHSAIAEAIGILLGDRKRLHRMGKRAREMARGQYSLETMERYIKGVYQSVIERRFQKNVGSGC